VVEVLDAVGEDFPITVGAAVVASAALGEWFDVRSV
jgi:hypothetical protein